MNPKDEPKIIDVDDDGTQWIHSGEGRFYRRVREISPNGETRDHRVIAPKHWGFSDKPKQPRGSGR